MEEKFKRAAISGAISAVACVVILAVLWILFSLIGAIPGILNTYDWWVAILGLILIIACLITIVVMTLLSGVAAGVLAARRCSDEIVKLADAAIMGLAAGIADGIIFMVLFFIIAIIMWLVFFLIAILQNMSNPTVIAMDMIVRIMAGLFYLVIFLFWAVAGGVACLCLSVISSCAYAAFVQGKKEIQ